MLDEAQPSFDPVGVSAADVSKGSFYHFFKSKEDLAVVALDDFISDGGAIMMQGPFTEISDPVDRALGFLKHVEGVSKTLWGSGCLLVVFSVDMANTHPKVKKETVKILDRLIRNIGDVLTPLAESLVIEMTGEALTHQYLSVIDGSIVYARATGKVGEIAANLRTFRKQMEALVGKD